MENLALLFQTKKKKVLQKNDYYIFTLICFVLLFPEQLEDFNEVGYFSVVRIQTLWTQVLKYE